MKGHVLGLLVNRALNGAVVGLTDLKGADLLIGKVMPPPRVLVVWTGASQPIGWWMGSGGVPVLISKREESKFVFANTSVFIADQASKHDCHQCPCPKSEPQFPPVSSECSPISAHRSDPESSRIPIFCPRSWNM